MGWALPIPSKRVGAAGAPPALHLGDVAAAAGDGIPDEEPFSLRATPEAQQKSDGNPETNLRGGGGGGGGVWWWGRGAMVRLRPPESGTEGKR